MYVIKNMKYRELEVLLQIKDSTAIILTENLDNDLDSSLSSVQIKCSNDHKVKIIIVKIINNTWCCRNCNQRKHTIQDFKNIAIKNEGLCLSDSYLGLNTHLIFQCKIGHEWKATPNNIKNKHSWCPQCKDLFNQERCRVILEFIFKKPFIICCPNFLYIEKTKKYLELDGYCEELNIAFEYQGIMHYELMYWDKGDETRLNHQKEKDKFKIKKCLEKNILLLVISYKDIKYKDDNHVKQFISNMLEINKILISDDIKNNLKNENIQDLIRTNNTKIIKYKNDVNKILLERNGILKDKNVNIINNRLTKFIVICIFGHEFNTFRENLMDKRKRWCPICSIKKNIKSIVDEKNLQYKNVIIIDCDRFGECDVNCKNYDHNTKVLFTDIKDNCEECNIIEEFKLIEL